MTFDSWLLLLVLWLGLGALIGRRSGRQGTGLLWAAALGPLGVGLFAYGESRRAEQRPPPQLAAAPADLDLPVQVSVDGRWLDGRLDTWTQANERWQGWVRYSVNDADQAGWFIDEHVRRAVTPS